MTFGREEGGPGGVAGEDRIDGARRAVDEGLAAAEEPVARQPDVVRSERQGVQDAFDRIVGGGRGLVHAQLAVRLDDEIGEGSAGIAGEPHATPSLVATFAPG